MIEKITEGVWEINCDSCSAGAIEIEADDFNAMIRELKEQGWRIFKNSTDNWCHACPDCNPEDAQDRMRRDQSDASTARRLNRHKH